MIRRADTPSFLPRSSRHRCQRNFRGSAALEMCLVLPILAMLGFGVADYGYFFFMKNTLQGAAQAGARAAIPPSAQNSDVTNMVSSMMSAAGISSNSYTVAITDTSGNAINVNTVSAGSSIEVTVSASWGTVGIHSLPTSLGGISNTKRVTGVAVMRKESS